MGEKGTGFNRSMLSIAFGDLENYLNGKNLTLVDAIRYSRKVDPNNLINGLPRDSRMYPNGSGNYNGGGGGSAINVTHSLGTLTASDELVFSIYSASSTSSTCSVNVKINMQEF